MIWTWIRPEERSRSLPSCTDHSSLSRLPEAERLCTEWIYNQIDFLFIVMKLYQFVYFNLHVKWDTSCWNWGCREQAWTRIQASGFRLGLLLEHQRAEELMLVWSCKASHAFLNTVGSSFPYLFFNPVASSVYFLPDFIVRSSKTRTLEWTVRVGHTRLRSWLTLMC